MTPVTNPQVSPRTKGLRKTHLTLKGEVTNILGVFGSRRDNTHTPPQTRSLMGEGPHKLCTKAERDVPEGDDDKYWKFSRTADVSKEFEFYSGSRARAQGLRPTRDAKLPSSPGPSSSTTPPPIESVTQERPPTPALGSSPLGDQDCEDGTIRTSLGDTPTRKQHGTV